MALGGMGNNYLPWRIVLGEKIAVQEGIIRVPKNGIWPTGTVPVPVDVHGYSSHTGI
jgi:hypothetical protein